MAEVLLRLLFPPDNRYYVWEPNYSATFNLMPGVMPGVGPAATFKVNSQGIIGHEWGDRDKEYRILTVGGSTTECLYLDQVKTWPALLQSGLGNTPDGRIVWVGNLGKAGFNTRDHLALMRLVIDQYDVDAILMLIGGNDLVHRLLQGNSYDPHFIEDDACYRAWLTPRFANVPPDMEAASKPFFKQTALWRLAQQLKRLHDARKAPIVQDRAGKWIGELREVRQKRCLVDELPSLDSGLDEYERNVIAIIQEAKRRNIRIVLATQPTIWKTKMSELESKQLWMGGEPGGCFYTTGALAKGMDSYNQRLLGTCANLHVECVDLATRVPRTLELCYDDMHFTERGAERVASELVLHFRTRANYLRGGIPVPVHLRPQ